MIASWSDWYVSSSSLERASHEHGDTQCAGRILEVTRPRTSRWSWTRSRRPPNFPWRSRRLMQGPDLCRGAHSRRSGTRRCSSSGPSDRCNRRSPAGRREERAMAAQGSHVDHGKNGQVCANAERKARKRGAGESRRTGETANGDSYFGEHFEVFGRGGKSGAQRQVCMSCASHEMKCNIFLE